MGKLAKNIGKAKAVDKVSDASYKVKKKTQTKKRGEKFKSLDEVTDQADSIQLTQSKVKGGKVKNKIIDSTRKSKQRAQNALNNITNLQDALDE